MERYIKLYEFAQRGVLYHFTDVNSFRQIMKSNSLKGNIEDLYDEDLYTISLTRNKNFEWQGKDVRIYLDGSKLSNKYKIKPFSFFGTASVKKDWMLLGQKYKKSTSDQSEEAVLTKEIKNIRNYITKVDVSEMQEEEFLDKELKRYRKWFPFEFVWDLSQNYIP